MVRQQHEEAMDGAQMRSLVEALGMGRRDVATLVGVNESTVRRWWANESTVPAAAVTHLSRWAHDSHELEQQLLEELSQTGVATVPEDQLQMPTDLSSYPPAFYRIAAARALSVYNSRARTPGRLEWID